MSYQPQKYKRNQSIHYIGHHGNHDTYIVYVSKAEAIDKFIYLIEHPSGWPGSTPRLKIMPLSLQDHVKRIYIDFEKFYLWVGEDELQMDEKDEVLKIIEEMKGELTSDEEKL